MTEIVVIKTQGGYLIPADDASREVVAKWKLGQGVRVEAVKIRNYKFHKKFFAMLDIGFDAFDSPEQEYKGLPVVKNRKRFRKDCIIAAGFYDLVVDLNGAAHAEAKSISFASMDNDEFELVYSAVADVLLQKVLRNYTRDDLDRVVDEIMGFVT